MGAIIVIEFVTADGYVSDPDGSAGTPTGGWAFRFGPDSVSGDKFQLGEMLNSGVMVLGRRTWELFAGIWPGRTDEFSAKMNGIPKIVASRSGVDTGRWNNSVQMSGPLPDAAAELRAQRDVIITGSLSLVRALTDADLVDEYRLLVFPSVIGGGDPLFPQGTRPFDLVCLSAVSVGAALLVRYGRSGGPAGSKGDVAAAG